LERSHLASFTGSGSYIGTVIALPLSGLLANNFGWPSVFYFFGEDLYIYGNIILPVV
jgi:ACS family sodium-dependent inorganic phosphate cotransporter